MNAIKKSTGKKYMMMFYLLLECITVAAQPAIYIARYADNKVAAVSYTFDDGLLEHYSMVFPALQKLHIKATFCIIGSKVGSEIKGTPCMQWSQLAEMADDGQEITNHGWAHKGVGTLSPEALRFEVQHNDTAIYEHTRVFPRTYFYPGNRKTDAAVAFCSKDRVGTRTTQVSIGSKRNAAWLKQWIDGLLATRGWGIGMTHGITKGYDAFPAPKVFFDHLDYVSTLCDKLWIATFHDVSAYCKERDNVSLKIIRHRHYLSVSVNTKLDKRIFNYPLTLVVEGHAKQAIQDGKQLVLQEKTGKTLMSINPYGGDIVIYL